MRLTIVAGVDAYQHVHLQKQVGARGAIRHPSRGKYNPEDKKHRSASGVRGIPANEGGVPQHRGEDRHDTTERQDGPGDRGRAQYRTGNSPEAGSRGGQRGGQRPFEPGGGRIGGRGGAVAGRRVAAGAGRCGRPRTGDADVRRCSRTVWPSGRAGQQRRHPPAQALHRSDAGRLGARPGRGAGRRVPLRPKRHTRDAGQRLRPHRVPHRRRRLERFCRAVPHLGGQDGRRRAGPGPGFGVRAAQHPGERGVPGPHRHQPRPGMVSRANMADTSEIPLGRLGHVDDIASACVFLVTDDCGFITGQTIHVNGGTAYF